MLIIEGKCHTAEGKTEGTVFFESSVSFSDGVKTGVPSFDRVKDSEQFLSRGMICRPSVLATFDESHPIMETFLGVSSRDELLKISDRYYIVVFVSGMPNADMMSRQLFVGTRRMTPSLFQCSEMPLIGTEGWACKAVDGGSFWTKEADTQCKIDTLEPALTVGWLLIDSMTLNNAGFNNDAVVFNAELDKHIETARLMLILEADTRKALQG